MIKINQNQNRADIISGKTGSHNPKSSEGWGRNACEEFNNYNNKIMNEGYVKPNYEIHYSKTAKSKKIDIGSLYGYADQGLKNIYPNSNGKVSVDKFEPAARLNQLSNLLKIPTDKLESAINNNPVKGDTSVLDTDGKKGKGDGFISRAENAAYTILQDMMDKHHNMKEKTGLGLFFDKIKGFFVNSANSNTLSRKDTDGKITTAGLTAAEGMIAGQRKDETREILKQVREGFKLDGKFQEFEQIRVDK